jgi:hypothetical protein
MIGKRNLILRKKYSIIELNYLKLNSINFIKKTNKLIHLVPILIVVNQLNYVILTIFKLVSNYITKFSEFQHLIKA